MQVATKKIGVFDSGIGGVTVLFALRRRFGSMNYVYFGDTAHVPYGAKSPAQIAALSSDCARILKEREVDALVVACNTASSWAIPAIQEVMGEIPVFGVVEPGVEAALQALDTWVGRADGLTADKRERDEEIPILVLATRATVKSEAYGKKLRSQLLDSRYGGCVRVYEQACPLLVPMIEEGWLDHPILHQTLAEYVQPYLSRHSVGVALLGCTHYPWIHEAFEKALPGWKVVNSASAIVHALEGMEWIVETETTRRGTVEWIFSDADAVPVFAQRWIKDPEYDRSV